MKEIVKATGLSKGAFYHYFSSKEALFKEIATIFFTLGTTDYTKFPTNTLLSFIQCYLKNTKESFKQINRLLNGESGKEVSFNFFFIMFEAISRFPEFLTLEKEMYNKDLNAWTQAIEHAKQQGEIKSDSTNTQLADLFLYCTDGTFIRVLNSDAQTTYANKLEDAFMSIYNNLH